MRYKRCRTLGCGRKLTRKKEADGRFKPYCPKHGRQYKLNFVAK